MGRLLGWYGDGINSNSRSVSCAVAQLEGVPVSVLLTFLLTTNAPTSPSVLSPTRSQYLQTVWTETESKGMALSLPPVVAVVMNPATQASEQIVAPLK